MKFKLGFAFFLAAILWALILGVVILSIRLFPKLSAANDWHFTTNAVMRALETTPEYKERYLDAGTPGVFEILELLGRPDKESRRLIGVTHTSGFFWLMFEGHEVCQGEDETTCERGHEYKNVCEWGDLQKWVKAERWRRIWK